jgi:transcriptional regulator with XRE-family HTH domain
MSRPETLPSAADREQLVTQLADANYRKAFVEAHAKDSIAFQLRMMRKAKDWDQQKLAKHAFGDPKLQSMVSRYENPDYGKYSLSTLLELAAAFDVALVIHFAPFSELLSWDETPVERKIIPASFQEELTEGQLVRKKRKRKSKVSAASRMKTSRRVSETKAR